jgi:hypothetical protein
MRGDVRCVDGRRCRHDPQEDDPYLETDVGPCNECEGIGCDTLAKIEAHIDELVGLLAANRGAGAMINARAWRLLAIYAPKIDSPKPSPIAGNDDLPF